VAINLAAVLGSTIGNDSQQWHLVFIKERTDSIVEHVGGCDRVLLRVEFCERDS